LSTSVDGVRQEVENRFEVAVDKASALSEEIANLNQQIVSTEGDGTTAGDLRDTRNRALDELASLLPIQVVERSNGSVGVTASGISIVDGAASLALETRSSGGVWGVAVQGRPGLLQESGGTIGGLLDVLNTDVPATRRSLDDLAAALVGEVNTLHATGTNAAGTTGADFFDASGSTASSIALDGAVSADADVIAAGTPDASGNFRAGANDVALAIGALRDADVASLGHTMGEQFQGLVSDIGLAVRSSTDKAAVHRSLSDQADARRLSTSGVSVDEELVSMIQFQTAYQAAARVVTAADEMLRTLIAM